MNDAESHPAAGASRRAATDAAGHPAFEPTTHPYRWVLLAGVWLMYFCFGMVAVTLAPLVGPIAGDLGLTRSNMGAVLGAWQLVYIASALPCGMVLDRFGPRRAILLAVGTIAASVVLRGVAGSFAGLLVAVAVFGLGGPLVSVGAPKLISLWFVGRERGFAMGAYITGPLLGSMMALSLTNSLMMPLFDGNWRSVIFAYAGIVVVAGLSWLAITAHPACGAVENRLVAEPKESQLKAFTGLIRIPAVRIVLAMGVGIFFFNHGLNNWLPEILRNGGMSAVAAGYWAAFPALVSVVSALTIPRLATPPRRLQLLLALFVSAAVATLLLHITAPAGLVVAMLTQGIARGAMMTLSMLTLLDIPAVGSRRIGLAGGLFFTSAEVGGVLGPISMGLIADLAGGFDAALLLLTGICLALVGLHALLRRTTGRAADDRPGNA